MLPRHLSVTFCSCLALTVGTAPARAQSPTPSAAAVQNAAPLPVAASPKAEMPGLAQLFTSLGGDFKHLASRQNLFGAGVGLAGSTSSHAWDDDISRSRWGREGVTSAFAPGRLVGDFATQAGGAFATYLVGRATDRPGIATLGAELFRAQLVAQTTTQALKLGTRRTRPDGTRLSLPSGHSAAAFATATVLHSRYGWKAGIPAYAVASWVAASRMQSQRHYLSDVIAGATVGILAGRSVTIGYRSTKFSVAPMVVSGGLGVSLVRIGAQ